MKDICFVSMFGIALFAFGCVQAKSPASPGRDGQQESAVDKVLEQLQARRGALRKPMLMRSAQPKAAADALALEQGEYEPNAALQRFGDHAMFVMRYGEGGTIVRVWAIPTADLSRIEFPRPLESAEQVRIVVGVAFPTQVEPRYRVLIAAELPDKPTPYVKSDGTLAIP